MDGPLGDVLPENVDGQRAAQLGALVVQAHVLDIDVGVAQPDRDLLQDPCAILDRDHQPVEIARLQILERQHPLTLLRRISDGILEAGGIVGRQSLEHLLQPLLEGGHRSQKRRPVVEEDVCPHAPIAAGDAREVAKARPRRKERVARTGVLPGLSHEHVGEHVRQMADDGHETVVLVGVDCDRARADLAEKAVETAVGLGVGVSPRREEVGRALVERGAGVADTGRLRPTQRVTADAAFLLARREGAHEGPLGAAHVADHGVRGGGRQCRLDVLDDEAHGRADEDEVSALYGILDARAGMRDGATLERELERGAGLAVAAHLAGAGALADGQPEGAAHEADADEGDGASGYQVHDLR